MAFIQRGTCDKIIKKDVVILASLVIHVAVAEEINKVIKKDKGKLLLGAIAPDVAKLVGDERGVSHFFENDEADYPNTDLFLEKYQSKMKDDFVLGYFIHLYTDYLWIKYFISEFLNENYITKLNGEVVKINGRMDKLYIYNDYEALNNAVIKKYNLDINVMRSSLGKLEDLIEEVPEDKLNVLVDDMQRMIDKSNADKNMVMTMDNVDNFIALAVDLILAKLDDIGVN